MLIPRSRAVFAPAQVLNFALVPPQFRFVFVGVVSLFWSASPLPPSPSVSLCAMLTPRRADTYLSAVNAQQKQPSEADVKDIGLTLA